jgi:phospholipid transport system substrate-binding protein
MFSRMNRLVVTPIWCFIFVLLCATLTSSWAAPDPTEQFRPFLDKVTTLLSDPSLKALPKKEQSQRVIAVVRERFDFREMSKRVLGPQWKKLSNGQQGDFETLFTQLLQYVYVEKIDEYSGQNIEFTQQRIKGNWAEVHTKLVDSNRTILISYKLLLHGDQWMAFDVVVEGISLIGNYNEQLQQIFKQDGYSGLIEQIKRKIGQLEQQYTRA